MTDLLSNFQAAFSSPMILCFFLGILAALIKSDLRLPEAIYSGITIYLLLAIGIKGGVKIADSNLGDFILPATVAILLGMMIPVWSYFLMRKVGRFGVSDSAAVSAHYGSVSVVTFGAGLAFLETAKISYEAYFPAILALMEFPGILVAVFIAKAALLKKETEQGETSWGKLFHDLLAGKSTVLLIGGLLIGYVTGKEGYAQISPFFETPFRGVLAIFLLEIGLIAGRHLGDIKKAGPFLLGFGILVPILNGTIGVMLGRIINLSEGGATLLGILAASASYIAAPAAVRIALPKANPAYYITASLAITFPFNITIGIPLFHAIACYFYVC